MCIHVGNTDLYGLGIRLGVYLQLFSTLIANHFLLEISQATWDANAVFLVAIFVAVVKSSTGSNTIAPFEAFVMLQMLLAFVLAVFNVTGAKWRSFDLMTKQSYVRFRSSPLGSFTRSTLTTGIACYQVWFWLRGIDVLGQSERCATFIFLFARVNIRSKAIIVFKVLSLLYLIVRVVRLVLDSPVSPIVQDVTGLSFSRMILGGEPQGLKKSLLNWYEPKNGRRTVKLSVGDREIVFKREGENADLIDRRPRPTERLGKDVVLFWHTVTLACSLVVIIYSIVAIETTLAWNGVSQVYSVAATGQLIPLTAGIAGAIQVAMQILTQWRSKMKARDRPAMKVDLESSTWRYRLLNGKTAKFTAFPRCRRWSLDTASSARSRGSYKPLEEEDGTDAQLAPVLPVLKTDQDQRIQECFYGREIELLPFTARSVYSSRNGAKHIFHHTKPISRRSFDAANRVDRDTWPRPHRARAYANIPLRLKDTTEHAENERKKWFDEAVTKLQRQWRREGSNDASDRASTRSYVPAWVQPGDVDGLSLFPSDPERRHRDRPHGCPRLQRRCSADDTDRAYSGRVGPVPLPFLAERARSRTRRRSVNSSSYYTGDSYHASNNQRGMPNMAGKFMTNIKKVFGQVAAALVNLICCCAPCTFARDTLARRRRRRHFGTLRQVSPESDGMLSPLRLSQARCMRCEECDLNLKEEATTRRRQKVNLAARNNRTLSIYLDYARLKELGSEAGEWVLLRIDRFLESRA